RSEAFFQGTHHTSFNWGGVHRVDADAGRRTLQGGGPHHADHGVFTGNIGRDAGGPANSRYRGGDDDAAAPTVLHLRHDILEPQPHSSDIDCHDLVKDLKRIVGNRLDYAFNPRVI